MMQAEAALQAQPAGDHAALSAACEPGVGLCTIVGIEGSFSRKVGAQLAILPDGSTVGSLSDGCLEAQLASDMRTMTAAQVRRYGAGAQAIDFRLPCGGGLDILLDPVPDRAACREAVTKLTARQVARLHLPGTAPIRERQFQPALRIVAFGEGPELAAIERWWQRDLAHRRLALQIELARLIKVTGGPTRACLRPHVTHARAQ